MVAKLTLHSLSLGLILALASCATTPVSTKPFTLAIEDGMVRFSIPPEDGLSITDFIKVAQQVTGKSYTYSKAEVAGEKKNIQLVGEVSMERAEFSEFVKTMLQLRGFECVARGSGDAETIEIRCQPKVVKAKPVAEVIQLTHVDCTTVMDTLRKLADPKEKPHLVVVGHVESNKIMLSGSNAQIAAAKDVIASIDQKK